MKSLFLVQRGAPFLFCLVASCATEVTFDAPDETRSADAGTPPAKNVDAGPQKVVEPPPVLQDPDGGVIAKPEGCGDGVFQDSEACDDGNTNDNDGCSKDCTEVALGFSCSEAGKPCQTVEVCGDGRQTLEESCDDGNTESGDGCTATCAREGAEGDFVCATPGMLCASTQECGDGRVSGDEICDDGNAAAKDGCDETCQVVEVGYSCATAGRPCIAAACGDSVIAGLETCDDGNAVAGDGCDATCHIELGFVCDTAGMTCRAAVCGDGKVEGGEPCDDGDDTNTGDGCTPGCILEPNCDKGACTSSCGDGITLATDDEECDDGNLLAGDGCSTTCKVEAGFKCEQVADVTNGDLVLPVVYRDFRGRDETSVPGVAEAHPDFQLLETATNRHGLNVGMVAPELGPGGKPVMSAKVTPWISSPESFAQWFRAVAGVNQTLVSTLTFGELPLQPGSYQFDDADFFPLDGGGWATTADPTGAPYEAARPSPTGPHNFFFTSELTYWFEYKKSGTTWPELAFRGDDDVWVYINRKLAVDLGGIHEPESDSVILDETAAGILELVVGNVYEIKVFQAERHTVLSSYQLTLSGFTRLKTTCQSVCGDGTVTRDEVCDDGKDNGPGYGQCTETCELGPRCGDGMVSPEEECDNGINLDSYKTSDTACAPGCKAPGFCGDGIVNTAFGEVCDDGVNDGSYNGCTPTCQLGPRCGDGIKQDPPETCDDGNQINGDMCDFQCIIEPPRVVK